MADASAQRLLFVQIFEVAFSRRICCSRVVISARDPGVNNWIDNESRGKGLMTLRTINGDKPPVVHTQVVKVAELKDILPADTQWVTEEERKAQVMIRREHMVSRFHR